MVGIYFSGTGNSRYALELFLQEYNKQVEPQRDVDFIGGAFSIEDGNAVDAVKAHGTIAFSYPVQYSTVPKILRDFVIDNQELWKNKKIFIIATMGLFSGDGAGNLGRLLQKYGGEIIGGLHLKMPDSIGDEKLLKRSMEMKVRLVKEAESKIKKAVCAIKVGKPPREGLGILWRMAGFFGQRLWFGHQTRHYSSKLKINEEECIGCGQCVRLCPMNNLELTDEKAKAGSRCTMCYRCINYCPRQAITLLGKKVVWQSRIEKYLEGDDNEHT